jgi:hypothetical protein
LHYQRHVLATSEEKFTGALTVSDSANNSPWTSSLSGTGD